MNQQEHEKLEQKIQAQIAKYERELKTDPNIRIKRRRNNWIGIFGAMAVAAGALATAATAMFQAREAYIGVQNHSERIKGLEIKQEANQDLIDNKLANIQHAVDRISVQLSATDSRLSQVQIDLASKSKKKGDDK